MNFKKNGNTFLFFVIISAALMLAYTALWNNTALLYDAVTQKYKYEKKYRVAESLANYGLSLLINNFEQTKKISNNVIYNSDWPPGQNYANANLKIVFSESEIIIIESKIKENNSNETFAITVKIRMEEIKDEDKRVINRKFHIISWIII